MSWAQPAGSRNRQVVCSYATASINACVLLGSRRPHAGCFFAAIEANFTQCPWRYAPDSCSANADLAQPPGLKMRSVEAGLFSSLHAGRLGLTTSSPPQLGQMPISTVWAQETQKVHSNEQMRASPDSGGRSQSQHSQFGRSSSMLTDSKGK